MKLKKKEDQSVDTSFLLRRGNKISMEGVTETEFRTETEGRTIQRLPHLGIYPIRSSFTEKKPGWVIVSFLPSFYLFLSGPLTTLSSDVNSNEKKGWKKQRKLVIQTDNPGGLLLLTGHFGDYGSSQTFYSTYEIIVFVIRKLCEPVLLCIPS